MKNQSASVDEIIASAKHLLEGGQLDKAQNLLLDNGYISQLEPLIQNAYLQLIPINPVLNELYNEVYIHLADPNTTVRRQAITKLLRELAKEQLRGNVRWMRDPRASEPIMKAVFDPDLTVSERALRALSRLVCRYFPDQRALSVFLSKLTDSKQETRTDAISGLGCLRREDLLTYLIPLMEQGTDQDRADVSAQIWGLSFETFQHSYQYPIEWSETGRALWRNKMITALDDSNVQVRKNAARALKGLGDRSAVPALQTAHNMESDQDCRFYIEETIAALEKKGPSPEERG